MRTTLLALFAAVTLSGCGLRVTGQVFYPLPHGGKAVVGFSK